MRTLNSKDRISEAIVLAGGMGSRLGALVENVPKPMLQIQGRPFLEYLLDELIKNEITTVVLSVGYRRDVIQRHFGDNYKSLQLKYCIEEIQLGTGGAIKKSLEITDSDDVLICNGDTFFPVAVQDMFSYHIAGKALCTVAVKRMDCCDRYGMVEYKEGRIIKFSEKKPGQSGFINGGIYIANKKIHNYFPVAEKFSIEKDVLEKICNAADLKAFESDAFFIDIGIPEDLQSAEILLKENAI